MVKHISYKAQLFLQAYFVMYLNLQSCAISVLVLLEQHREILPNSHWKGKKQAMGLCPQWF